MKTALRWGLLLLLPALLIVEPAGAYDYPLSSEAIREAYFLGSGDPNKRAQFFEKYTKRYAIPKSGQYVGLIQFETPYMLTAQRVSQNVSNYFAQDAEQEFLGKPAVCRVRVEVYWGYNSLQLPAGPNYHYQTDYTVQLKQDDKEIRVKSKWTETLVGGESAPIDIGIEFNNEYDASSIHSATATVEVLDPGGKTLVESFDLDSLR
jgi:hypothetical protein